MRVVEPGHVYDIDYFSPDGTLKDSEIKFGRLNFCNKEAGTEHVGTNTQEVIRALIDRTQHCDRCLRWPGNDQIIHHLRMALVLHEARALARKTEKGSLCPELVETGNDGHFTLTEY